MSQSSLVRVSAIITLFLHFTIFYYFSYLGSRFDSWHFYLFYSRQLSRRLRMFVSITASGDRLSEFKSSDAIPSDDTHDCLVLPLSYFGHLLRSLISLLWLWSSWSWFFDFPLSTLRFAFYLERVWLIGVVDSIAFGVFPDTEFFYFVHHHLWVRFVLSALGLLNTW